MAKGILMSALTLCMSLTMSTSMSVKASDKLVLSGVVEQGGLIVGHTSPDSSVTLNDKEINVSEEGAFAFGFGRDDTDTHVLVVTHADKSQTTRTLKPAIREYNIQRIEGIKKSIMKPNPEAVARSRKDNTQIAVARKSNNNFTAFSNGFIAPADGVITGVYGSQRVFNGEKKRPHFGLDYAGKTGDPVKAPADGKVTLFVPDMFYSGGTMIIDHGHGVTSTFLHLSKSYVKEGEWVKQGQKVAAIGASGRATGPHLDWRVNWFNVRLDPALALKLPAQTK